MLDSPTDVQEIYLARGKEVDAYRPVCQGDVFLDVDIPPRMLLEASAAVLEELELQENWNLAFVAPDVEEGSNALELLEAEALLFDDLLSAGEQNATLRDRLQVPEARAEVRRAVNEAIRERRRERSG